MASNIGAVQICAWSESRSYKRNTRRESGRMVLAIKSPAKRTLILCSLICGFAFNCLAEDTISRSSSSPLDRGFIGLYNLDFSGAQQEFSLWEREHPDDPVGPVSEAAGFLFSEFNRLGVLEAQFYENDAAFEKRSKFSPDPIVREHFQAAISRAQTLSRAKLSTDPKEPAIIKHKQSHG